MARAGSPAAVRSWRSFWRRKGGIFAEIERVGDDALDAAHGGEAADLRDVGGLGGPGGQGAGAGGDDLDEAGDGGGGAAGAVGEQFFQHGAVGRGKVAVGLREVDKFGADGAHGEAGALQILQEFLQAERREGRRAAENQHGGKGATLANIAGAVKGREIRSVSRAPAAKNRHKTRGAEKAVDHSGALPEIAPFPMSRDAHTPFPGHATTADRSANGGRPDLGASLVHV